MKQQTTKLQKNKALLVLALSSGLILALTACSDSRMNREVTAETGDNLQLSAGVTGGQVVQAGSRVSRSVVAVFAKGFGICSGTLISNNAILTAAHCIPSSSIARLQVAFSTNVSKATPAQIRQVSRTYVHQWYGQRKNQERNTGDIAIIKFTGGLPPGYSPVNLLPNNSLIANRSIILISGFGVTNGVTGSGSGVLRDTISIITNSRFSETEVEVSQMDGRGSCNGDSGGPSFITYGGAYYLWGVVSRGDETCRTNGIYTNAVAYRNWINQALQAP